MWQKSLSNDDISALVCRYWFEEISQPAITYHGVIDRFLKLGQGRSHDGVSVNVGGELLGYLLREDKKQHWY